MFGRIFSFASVSVGVFLLSPSFSGAQAPIRYQLHYRVEVPALPDAKKGMGLRLWVPYPADGPFQKVVRSEIRSPFPWHIEKEKTFGNKILFIKTRNRKTPWLLEVNLTVERRADEGLSRAKSKSGTVFDPARYVGATPWVPFDKMIREIARAETKPSQSDFEKIKSLYAYVYNTMTYNKEGKGWGKGDPVWACTNKRGNCTDFHSLLIALARTQNIPARFEIGLPIPEGKYSGGIPGYHCWAQLFEKERGWIPADASESKKAGKMNAYFGKLPADRILLSTGRGIRLEPPQAGEPLNFFFYPYAEFGGKPVASLKIDFTFQKLPNAEHLAAK